MMILAILYRWERMQQRTRFQQRWVCSFPSFPSYFFFSILSELFFCFFILSELFFVSILSEILFVFHPYRAISCFPSFPSYFLFSILSELFFVFHPFRALTEWVYSCLHSHAFNTAHPWACPPINRMDLFLLPNSYWYSYSYSKSYSYSHSY